MLLLLFLGNQKVILTNFTLSQNSWGPTTSTLALWWLTFGPIGICLATKFVPAKWGMFGDLKALCRLHLNNMKKQLVGSKRCSVWRSSRKNRGCETFFKHRGGYFFSGRSPLLKRGRGLLKERWYYEYPCPLLRVQDHHA